MKRKCPRCGSKDVAEILRGMPVYSEELKQAIADHKIILGGCSVTGSDPSAHCNACGKDFGKPPYVRRRRGQAANEPRELLPDIVTGIIFSEGGYFGGSDHVEITTRDGEHIYSYTYYGDRHIESVSNFGEITDVQWNRLMDTLFRKLCIHEWKKRYVDPYVCDGTEWELELKLTGGRRYTIYGSNDFPALYKDLYRAFKPFMKKPEKELI